MRSPCASCVSPDGQQVFCVSTLVHPNTACAAGIGTGMIAELLLSGVIRKPGVWSPEQAVSTSLFEAAMQSRGVEIQQQLFPTPSRHPFEVPSAVFH
ncbi:hypothetical protein [Nostoc sp. FACHB-888]|uniref:hypothetical protein n=1 Tax=Nostoc sp. FACHB-888 TaxID=2692842 RepID=UPI0016859CA9|nr:hypothetical protein [Nostoc sp. FACHB-888]MBD2248919.1 hypothetical protein [Nostoc sp. FACHB-888]